MLISRYLYPLVASLKYFPLVLVWFLAAAPLVVRSKPRHASPENPVSASIPSPVPAATREMSIENAPVNPNQRQPTFWEVLLEGVRRDWVVGAATLLLFLATLALWRATKTLVDVTNKHVTHSEKLANTVDSILKIDRKARLVVSLVTRENKLFLLVKNVGRVPCMIEHLSFEFVGQGLGPNKNVADSGAMIWINPSAEWQSDEETDLQRGWNNRSVTSCQVACEYRDVYGNKGTDASDWMVSHSPAKIRCQLPEE